MERGSSLVWTDEEVGVLLNVTLRYKRSKASQDEDWETYKSKYGDLTDHFHAALSHKTKSKDFPRVKGETTKAQVTAKLKNIRGKYKQAAVSGRRNGHGRTVLIYYELCRSIWGGGAGGVKPVPALGSGLETLDLNGSEIKVEALSPPVSPKYAPDAESAPGSETESASASWSTRLKRKGLPTEKTHCPANGYPRPMKRRVRNVEEEELDIKRSMLELLRQQVERADERMDRLVSNMETLVNTIAATHAQLLAQSQCTCRIHPQQPTESNGTASRSEAAETDSTLKVTDTFTLASLQK